MDLDTKFIALVGLGISVANFVLTWGVALYMYLANKNKVTNERIDSLEDDVTKQIDKLREETDQRGDDHDARINRLEVRVEEVPTHEDLSKMHEKINKVSDGVSNIGGELAGVKNLLDTIHKHLLKAH